MNRFKLLFLVFIISSVSISSCTDSKNKLNEEITSLEEVLYNKSSLAADSVEAEKIIDMYLTYVQKYPADSISADYLFKAGDVSSKIGKIEQAVSIFEQLVTNYPENHNSPYGLFLQGFIYDNQSGEPLKAKPYYEKFLQQYPDHPIAADVNFSLDNLGKSPEDLIREFEQNALLDSTNSITTEVAN